MEITPMEMIHVSNVKIMNDYDPEELLALLPGLHANPYLSDSAKALLLALVGAPYAESGLIAASRKDLSQISMYLERAGSRVVVNL